MVVLPEPEGPIKVTRSPCATVKFRSFSTVLSPKRLMTSVNSMCGVSGAAPREVTLSPGWNLPPPAEAELWVFSGRLLLQLPDEGGLCSSCLSWRRLLRPVDSLRGGPVASPGVVSLSPAWNLRRRAEAELG